MPEDNFPKVERAGTWPGGSDGTRQQQSYTGVHTEGVEPMSVTFSGQVSGQPVRRVREEVRDGLAVIAFSATASSALAVALTVFVHLGH